MTDQLQQAAQQAQLVLQEHIRNNYESVPQELIDVEFALRVAIEQALGSGGQADPAAYHGWVLREVLFDNGEPVGHRAPQPQQSYTKDDLDRAYHAGLVEGERVAFSAPQPKRKQEPVASIYISPSGERELDDWRVELPVGRNLLYTAPQPKREWVGLTDEEIVHVTGHCGVSIIAATTVYRAIEPKLREKNGGGV